MDSQPDDIETLKAELAVARAKAADGADGERWPRLTLCAFLLGGSITISSRKSERLSEDQLSLGIEDLETAIAGTISM